MKTFHVLTNLQSYVLTFLILLLWFIPCTLSGQRYISGRITDAADGEPIPSATVFFTNTTVGITTDLDGNFRLKIPGEGSYSLTVSHVGYQSVVKDIEPGASSLTFNVTLKIQELDDVVVSAGIRFRRTDINLFWRTILGKNPSRRTIQATNPETVYYYYNPATRTLKVTCREPLQIVNYETGYRIQYILENFTHDYNTGITDWSHQFVFTELEHENPRQQNSWEEKRREVYNVSLTKFIKSLYNNSLENDGFVMADLKIHLSDPSSPFNLTFLNPDSVLSASSIDGSKTLNLSNRQILLICYGKAVTEADSIRLDRSQFPTGRYSSSIDMGRGGYVASSYTPGEHLDKNGLYRSMLQGKSIRIFSDGTFTNEVTMASVNDASSSPLMGLSMKLPIDYNPEGSTLMTLVTENLSDFDIIVQKFDNQLSVFPQEKIHLHTDRDVYVSGEKIWFKAYLTDALTHQPVVSSQYVYVELISPVDTLMHRVMIRPTNDMFYGNLPLTEEYVPTGNYTLRAYTRHMENLGDDYFFKKNIRIENIASPVNQQRPTANRGLLKDDYIVSFYPEGGNLLEGVLSKVAFKAININGYSETVSGKLVDLNGIEITTVETLYAGMGVFDYIPATGKKIYLKCKNTNGLEKQFELPQPDPRAYALSVSQPNKRISIKLQKSPQSPNSPPNPLYLLAHCRGMVLYFAEWDKKENEVLFDAEEFPSGIIQFILFDDRMDPLSERLIFSKNYTEAKVEFHADKISYAKRENVVSTLSITDSDGNLLHGNLSVAITDDRDIAVDSSNTILSTLLLSSELKGHIENPAYYLQDNTESETALDYLMLTHGWRRYNIPEVAKGNPKSPQIPFEMSQEISGNVKRPVRSRSIANSQVLILLEDGIFSLTSTDENGKFIFTDFEYPESTTYFLRAINNRGNDRVELILDQESFPKMIHAPQSPIFVETGHAPSLANDFMMKAEQRARYDEDMWVIQLGEIEVTAQRIVKKAKPLPASWANSGSDINIGKEEIEKITYRNPSDYISWISLLHFSTGPRSLEMSSEPLLLVDGIPTTKGDIDSQLPVEAIESINVFKYAGTAAFGARGANGVINITTKRGGENNYPERDLSNYIVYTPLGYQQPVDFYSPNYETSEAKYLSIPDFRTTIFWKPDIVVDDAKEATFEFYTSDFPTTYSVVIEGLTTNGQIVRQVEKIRIE